MGERAAEPHVSSPASWCEGWPENGGGGVAQGGSLGMGGEGKFLGGNLGGGVFSRKRILDAVSPVMDLPRQPWCEGISD